MNFAISTLQRVKKRLEQDIPYIERGTYKKIHKQRLKDVTDALDRLESVDINK